MSELLDHPFCLFFRVHYRCCLWSESGHASGAANAVTTPSPLCAVSKRRLARAASLFFSVSCSALRKREVYKDDAFWRLRLHRVFVLL